MLQNALIVDENSVQLISQLQQGFLPTFIVYCQLKCRLALLCGFPQKGFEDICWKNLSWASKSLILSSVASIFLHDVRDKHFITNAPSLPSMLSLFLASAWKYGVYYAWLIHVLYVILKPWWSILKSCMTNLPHNKHYNITPNKLDFWDCLTLPKTNSSPLKISLFPPKGKESSLPTINFQG